MTRTAYRRLAPLFLMILAVASLGLVACQAAMETKKGELGEFCNNRDSDCREGKVCQDGVCVLANPAITDACQQVCDKVQSCGAQDPNCVNDCSDEIANWGDSVIETFAQCVVSDLSCQELGNSAQDAAQTCYDRLPLAEQRVERCRTFIDELQSCQPNADTGNFQSECIYRARTASEERWSTTESCLEPIEFGNCDETASCINTVFDLQGDAAF